MNKHMSLATPYVGIAGLLYMVHSDLKSDIRTLDEKVNNLTQTTITQGVVTKVLTSKVKELRQWGQAHPPIRFRDLTGSTDPDANCCPDELFSFEEVVEELIHLTEPTADAVKTATDIADELVENLQDLF